MGCFALKRKSCAVIAHVIDQDIEPEEWAEVYEALSGTQALGSHNEANSASTHQQGLINRRRSSFIHAIQRSFKGGGKNHEGGAHTRLHDQLRLQETRSGRSEGDSVQLLMLSGRKSCQTGKRQVEVFPCYSPEADPLLELESFSWNKAPGLRLRNARTGKLLMTLVPVDRPAPPPSVALPEDCQLPGIHSDELDASWELCRIYADGRVVASVRTSLPPSAPSQPPSCWQDFTAPLKRRPCRQTFRVWVAATGAVEAACSRCPSFKTDESSGHEVTWDIRRGLGVSVPGQPPADASAAEIGRGLGVLDVRRPSGEGRAAGVGLNRVGDVGVSDQGELVYGAGFGNGVNVQQEVRDYWAQVANAQQKWDDRECVTSAEAEENLATGRESKVSVVPVVEAGAVLAVRTAEIGQDAGNSDGVAESLIGGCELLGREGQGAGHASRRSIESVDEFFDSRSVRVSDSGSEGDLPRDLCRDLKRASSKSLGSIGSRRDVAGPDKETEIAYHCRSKSAECNRGGEEDAPRVSSRCWLGEHLTAENEYEPNVAARPPLRRMGMLESFLSSQKSPWLDSPRNALARPLLSYRSSGLEYDPIADVRPLQPQGSSIPSAFNTSAMVPLSVQLERTSRNRVEIVFRNAGSDQRLGEEVIASAKGSGFACKKRMTLNIDTSCPADTLALTMLAQYLRGLVALGQ